MGDSSDDEFDDKNWVFYKDRPEWKDVEPLPQDGDENVVSIAYSQKCLYQTIIYINFNFNSCVVCF